MTGNGIFTGTRFWIMSEPIRWRTASMSWSGPTSGAATSIIASQMRRKSLSGTPSASSARQAAVTAANDNGCGVRSEEHTSELQSLMRISYAVFCLNKKTSNNNKTYDINTNL